MIGPVRMEVVPGKIIGFVYPTTVDRSWCVKRVQMLRGMGPVHTFPQFQELKPDCITSFAWVVT